MTSGGGTASETASAWAVDWLVARDHAADPAAHDRMLEEWLDASPRHQQAFTDMAGLWDDLAALPEPSAMAPRSNAWRRWWPAWVAAAAAMLLVMAGTLVLRDRTTGYATEVGERDVAMLDDGSRVTLNTDTAMRVDYSRTERRIILDRGEALFEVASQPDRPFAVEAAGRKIVAVGTVFMVRREPAAVKVTLIEGKVLVDPAGGGPAQMLVAGQRMALRDDGGIDVDRPQIDVVTAWRNGELVLRDTPLSEAVAEMNRYARRPIRLLVDPGDRRLTGIFATSRTREFGTLIAQLYDWSLDERNDSLVLRPRRAPVRAN